MAMTAIACSTGQPRSFYTTLHLIASAHAQYAVSEAGWAGQTLDPYHFLRPHVNFRQPTCHVNDVTFTSDKPLQLINRYSEFPTHLKIESFHPRRGNEPNAFSLIRLTSVTWAFLLTGRPI